MRNIAVAVGLLLAMPVWAQTPQTPFKTGVNVVEVDVVVTEKGGRPVRGLTQDDFIVLEDGKPVSVATFTAIDVPSSPAGSPVPARDQSGTSVATNDVPEDGRVILVVFDAYHVGFDAGRLRAAREIVKRLVERLGPSDLAAIVATSGQRSSSAEFTSDKGRLLDAADHFFPESEVSVSSGAAISGMAPSQGRFGFTQEIKARWARDTLNHSVKALAEIPHRRKSVLLISQGLPASLEEIISNQHAMGASQALRDFIVTAQRSNVAIYPIDPCGLVEDAGCSSASRENLRTVAEGTGGFAVVNTNAPEFGVDRLVDEAGTYYLIGYYSPAPPYDGKRHRIQVRTKRPGVTVRAREGYIAARRPPAAAKAADPLESLTSGPIQTRGLPMRVGLVPVPGTADDKAMLVVAIELSGAEAAKAGSVDFGLIVADRDGKVKGRQKFSGDFSTRTTSAPSVARLATQIPVEAGRYHVRVAALGANGVRGSVYAEVTVPKFTGDFDAGGLTLATRTPIHLVGSGKAGPATVSPIAARELARTTGISVELPIRLSGRTANAELITETALVQADGSSTVIDRGSRPASEYATQAGQVYRAALPENLAPGAYKVVVTASSGGKRVTRELPFRVVATR
jgi:VWFA-related protein